MQPFAYSRPSTVRDALRLAAERPETRFVAGGTTLYDLMKLGVERPERVVDLSGISELTRFSTSGRRELRFGALAKMSDVAEDARLVREYPALSEALWKAASQQLRNMASLGGNLLQRTRCSYFRHGAPFACNKREPGSGCAAREGLNRGHALLGGSTDCIAVYPGDWAVALAAFGAELDIVGPRGPRTIPIDQLHVLPGSEPHRETTLARDEMIVRIRVPTSPLGRASTYHKIRDRESYAFALASAAVAVEIADGEVRAARIALGGVATKPWRAHEAERFLVGERLTYRTARAAADLAFRDARGSEHSRFRIELGARTVADALLIAQRRA